MFFALLFLALLQFLDRFEHDLDAITLATAHTGLQFRQQPCRLVQVLQRLVLSAQRRRAPEAVERLRCAVHGRDCGRELRSRFGRRNAQEKRVLKDLGVGFGLALNGRNIREP